MNKKIISFVKYNRVLLAAYRICFNGMIGIMKCFIPVRRNRILFMSFGGQKYDDSPKALYEKMKQDPFFRDYEMVWAFDRPEKYDVDCKTVRIDTPAFYKAALSCGIWVNNSSVERGLHLRRKETFEINTWHGTPLKRMGEDIKQYKGYSSSAKAKDQRHVLYCAQSEFDRDIWVNFFHTNKENIIISDLPRNDSLFRYSDTDKVAIREKLGIAKNKKIILYAPTFREFARNNLNQCYIKPPMTPDKWRERLSDDYVVLFRAHYEIVKVLNIQDDTFIKNVSAYPCLNDLMAIADVLISDYSSIYFDFSITGKPMLNFAYDLGEYTEKRGLYFDLHEILPCRVNLCEDDLIDELLSMDYTAYSGATLKFKARFAPQAGNASETVLQRAKEFLTAEE